VSEASAGWVLLTPLNVVTAPIGMVLVRFPFVTMVTLMVMVQVVAADSDPPLKVMVLSPTAPDKVPPQVPVLKLGGLAMIIPAGIVSVNSIPVRGALSGLRSSMLMVEAEPPNTVNGIKGFIHHNMEVANCQIGSGWCGWMDDRRRAVNRSADVRDGDGVGCCVVEVPRPCTFTLMVQIPGTPPTWAGIVPPVRVINCVFATAVRVPPQVVVASGTAAIHTPLAGGVPPMVASESVRETFTNCVAILLVSVIVRRENPLGFTVGG